MFTGLVEKVGHLCERTPRGNGSRLVIEHDSWDTSLEDGESVAVQGAYLTVTGSDSSRFWCDVLAETLEKTTLGSLPAGSALNLERAMRMGDRFGGHIVSGHVDETGSVDSITRRGDDIVIRIRCSQELAGCTVIKGSITLDGVSLTVSDFGEQFVEVNIIPFTLAHTSLHERKEGSAVNLESDILGKYVARLLNRRNECSGVTMERLANAGFIED